MRSDIHTPVYHDDGARESLCGARDGLIGETRCDTTCPLCDACAAAEIWEVVDECD